MDSLQHFLSRGSAECFRSWRNSNRTRRSEEAVGCAVLAGHRLRSIYVSFQRQRLEKSAKLSRATLQQVVQGKPCRRAIQALFPVHAQCHATSIVEPSSLASLSEPRTALDAMPLFRTMAMLIPPSVLVLGFAVVESLRESVQGLVYRGAVCWAYCLR